MTWPLGMLALLTVVSGLALGIPSEHGTTLARFLAPVFGQHETAHGGLAAYMLVVLAIIVAAAGVVLAWYMYASTPVRPAEIGRPRSGLPRLLLNAYYVDALYDRLVVRPLFALCDVLASLFDPRVIDGLVNATGKAVLASGTRLRRLQSGYTVNYALTMLLGAVLLVGFFLAR
jgi:NADH-quinone oxidoreductase subunit L